MYDHIIPTIEEKVRHMPHVYYFNLDHETDRKEYMEAQLNHYGIDYTRVSQSKYLANEFEHWSHLVDDPDFVLSFQNGWAVYHLASLITHLECLKEWFKNTTDEAVIVLEDDYDISLIDYWHFTWEYLMDNIPYDWDSIQFSFETDNAIHFFLHPRFWYDSGFGAMMLGRSYVNKLLNILYDKNGIVKVKNNIQIHPNAPMPPANHIPYSVDNCIGGTGVTYRLPLVTMNYEMQRSDKITSGQSWIHHFYCEQIVKKWWKHKRDNFSLEDFFTYGKPNDSKMTINVNETNAFI